MTTLSHPAEILLVEDNPGDVELTMEALQTARVVNHISVLGDGVHALAYLQQRDGYEAAPCPDLILLDLNLPKLDGFHVLRAIKEDPHLAPIPVIILTGSEAERDIVRSYAAHANCLITKPIDPMEFLSVLQTTGEFWLSIVRLPPSPAPEP